MESRKIFILPIPALGHLNTILTVANELVKEPNINIYIYGNESVRNKIEEIKKCEYRDMCCLDIESIQRNLQKNTKASEVFPKTAEMMLNAIDQTSLKIAEDIEKDRPDLILFDNMSNHAKWSYRILKKRNIFIPKVIIYHPQFVNQKDVFPNAQEENILMNMGFFDKLSFLMNSVKLYFSVKSLSRKYDLENINLKEDFMLTDTSFTNIAFFFPQLQARSELLHENIKFVGACINDGPHLDNLNNVKDDSIKNFLIKFPSKNPTDRLVTDNENFLIYISLGSIFTNNFEFYQKAIDALKEFELSVKTSNNTKKCNIFAIINVGKQCYENFNNDYKLLPDNILLVPFAPQLEVLKRASIFLTHCGMNSTSEAIWFGVPMICLPISVDQPLVAHRVTNELGLGIKLDKDKVTNEDLFKSFQKIYQDDSFQKKSYEYSQHSRKYNGIEGSLKIIKSLI